MFINSGVNGVKTLSIFADPEQQHLIEQYAAVKVPIYAVSALDDDWALPASCRAFMQHYRQAQVSYVSLQPQDVAMKTIGHMGYFKKDAEHIWNKIRTTFDGFFYKTALCFG